MSPDHGHTHTHTHTLPQWEEDAWTRRGSSAAGRPPLPQSRSHSRGGEEAGSGRRHALAQQVVAAAHRLHPLLRHLPALRGAGLLHHRAAAGGAAAARHGSSAAGVPQPELRQRRVPAELPRQGAGGQQVRRVGAHQRLRALQLGPPILHVLRQHSGHHRRLRPHHPSVGHGESLLHPLRSDRRPLHHAGADGVRPEAHVPSGLRPRRAPAALGLGASAGHRGPLRAAAGLGGALLLCGSGGRVQRARSVLVIPGWRLLLFHLVVHHWTGRLCAGDAARTGVQGAVPDHCHGLPLRWSDDDVPPAAYVPQDGGPARPDHLPAAAALRGVRPGGGPGTHRGDQPQRAEALLLDEQRGQQASGTGIAALVQLHHQRLNGAAWTGGQQPPPQSTVHTHTHLLG